jgi:hypothetical protein
LAPGQYRATPTSMAHDDSQKRAPTTSTKAGCAAGDALAMQ